MIHDEEKPVESTDVGLYLRKCRRALGLSIEEVAGRTRIRTVILRQVETGDLSQIPPTYVKGFIRAYGGAVGADVNEALRRYESSRTINPRFETAQAPPKTYSTSFWPRLLVALLIFGGLIAATIYVAGLFQRPDSPAATQGQGRRQGEIAPSLDSSRPLSEESTDVAPRSAIEAPVSGESIPQAAELQASAQAAVLPGAPELPGVSSDGVPATAEMDASSRLVLELRAVEQSWMRITRDNGSPREITMKPDDRVTLEAQQRFELLIGNAGGILLKLNDGLERVAGAKGRVVRVILP